MELSSAVFRPATESDLETVIQLERHAYPPDESASEASLRFRLKHAGAYFWVAEAAVDADGRRELVGFVCGTRVPGPRLEHASMSSHDPEGAALAVHSVVVAPPYRRLGLATWIMSSLARQMALGASPALERVVLLAKPHNTALYQRCGFLDLGESHVQHGSERWHEMVLALALHPSHALPLPRVGRRAAFRPCFVVDAFTREALKGNAAAVVPMPALGAEEAEAMLAATRRAGAGAADDTSRWCARVARENNLSETAFVWPRADGRWVIRWFTPSAEVDLCGHATLAAAHTLWSAAYLPLAQRRLRFESLSGPLHVERRGPADALGASAGGAAQESADEYTLDFPAEVTQPLALRAGAPSPADVLGALQEAGVIRGPPRPDGSHPDVVAAHANRLDVLVHVTRAAFDRLLDAAAVNVAPLRRVRSRGVLVTAPGSAPAPVRAEDDAATGAAAAPLGTPDAPAFVSRCFFPNFGVDEDPVTGSAHCALAPYWEAALGAAPGTWMCAHQASARGGYLWTRVLHAGSEAAAAHGARVLLRGAAVTSTVGALIAV